MRTSGLMRPSKFRLPTAHQSEVLGECREGRIDGPGVADAGGAAEPHQVKAERLEVGQQPGARVVKVSSLTADLAFPLGFRRFRPRAAPVNCYWC